MNRIVPQSPECARWGIRGPRAKNLRHFFSIGARVIACYHDVADARLTLTHEEIAQVIGTSRETVTRLLSGFKKNGLIQWKGCNLALTDRAALESSAAN